MKKIIGLFVVLILSVVVPLTMTGQAAPLTEHYQTIGDDDSNTNNLPYGDTNRDQERLHDNKNNYPDGPTRSVPNTSQNPRNINNITDKNNGANFTQTATTTGDNDKDFGWIGIFGLLGLLGLLRSGRQS
jgi:hypothetical protein